MKLSLTRIRTIVQVQLGFGENIIILIKKSKEKV
jgi:hypothetical protein